MKQFWITYYEKIHDVNHPGWPLCTVIPLLGSNLVRHWLSRLRVLIGVRVWDSILCEPGRWPCLTAGPGIGGVTWLIGVHHRVIPTATSLPWFRHQFVVETMFSDQLILEVTVVHLIKMPEMMYRSKRCNLLYSWGMMFGYICFMCACVFLVVCMVVCVWLYVCVVLQRNRIQQILSIIQQKENLNI